MERELKSRVAIVGGGSAGCFCANQLQNYFDVTIFDKKSILGTILPTGGGRCNLAHAEYDFRELAKNYPRGEKFLYSIFSKFSTSDTLEFFENIGIKAITQDDGRIFPESMSSKDVREKFLKSLNKVKFLQEEVLKIDKNNSDFVVTTDNGSHHFDKIIIAIGGHSSYFLIEKLGHKIIPPRPSLVGLKTKENFSSLSGVAVNNILFTHQGVSGPEIYKISSIRARENFPYKLNFDFVNDLDLQAELNKNPHKDIKNLLGEFVPKSLGEYILDKNNISHDKKCHQIDGKTRDIILNSLKNFEITVTGTVADSEVVTSGGVDLDEINPKTMESKIVKGLYFCGEVVDIDGFCGGFNLQNCWSTAYVASQGVMQAYYQN